MWNKHRKAFIAGNYLHIMRVKINSNYLLKLKGGSPTRGGLKCKIFHYAIII